MKKKEILRGRDLFKRVATAGKTIDTRRLRCRYVVEPYGGEGQEVLVGFRVSSRDFDAVRRNRLKRLMREAMRREHRSLQSFLPSSHTRIALVLYYKGRDDVSARRLSLAEIQREVEEICRTLQQRLTEGL